MRVTTSTENKRFIGRLGGSFLKWILKAMAGRKVEGPATATVAWLIRT
jgi:hypothetical protein